ncbi:MAG: hypothetical protein WCA39_06620 [Nitrososphaeraceae archaeon]
MVSSSTLSFNALIKKVLASSMNILHLSVFTPNQLSALHVPEEKQKQYRCQGCHIINNYNSIRADHRPYSQSKIEYVGHYIKTGIMFEKVSSN